jgi:post-segregation antitoxin (ccd killing protein)
VDKLAAEFADELDALGVRVAALEKKSDNVKITGQVRWNYGSSHSDANKKYNNGSYGHSLRTRINFNGKVNDTWNYYATLENRQNLTNNVGDEETHFTVANLSGRLGGVRVTAGRMYHTVTPLGDIYDEKMDGIEISYGKKVRIGAYYGKLATAKWQTGNKGTVAAGQGWAKSWGVNLAADLGKNVTVFAGWDKFTHNDYGWDDNGIFDIGAKANFGKFGVDATYLKGNSNSAQKKNGFVATIGYGGANYAKPGTWGLEAKYYHMGDGTFVAHTMNGDYGVFSMLNGGGGMKGYKVGGYWTVAKNMRAGIEYYDLKDLVNTNKARTVWTEFQIKF